MKNIILLFSLSISLLGWSQKEVKSFYFSLGQDEPTKYSQEQLSILNYSLNNGAVKILEINAFTDSIGSESYNENLASLRLKYITDHLDINEKVILNKYALQRPYKIDPVLNWRRVDVIYEIINENIELTSIKNNEQISDPNDTINLKKEVNSFSEDVDTLRVEKETFDSSLNEMTPFIMDISFKEGTSKILESSFSEITKLVIYLKENPTIKAEIRGHVCCGNNMRVSRSRAKSVYKRLIKQGVDKDRLAFRGMSNKEPLVFPETTNEDRQKNRRVDVNLYK